MWIVVVLALLGNVADGDGVPRAVLKASKALCAVCADDSLIVLYLDVASGADASALSAGDAAAHGFYAYLYDFGLNAILL